eukprot:3659159-Pleurochrysis_carterae.AAC.1
MEPMNSTSRVTPLETLTRMLGLRCVMRFGREEAAIAARRACRAAVNKNSSRAADGARRSCR